MRREDVEVQIPPVFKRQQCKHLAALISIPPLAKPCPKFFFSVLFCSKSALIFLDTKFLPVLSAYFLD
jgi:hypothetical protein